MEEKDIVNTTAEELSSAKPDYEKEIASIIRSNASPAQIKDKLLDYHENDIAAALDSMSISERQRLYRLLNIDELSDIFEYVDEDNIPTYFKELDIKKKAAVVSEMDADKAVFVLQHLDKKTRDDLIELIGNDARRDIALISSFDEMISGQDDIWYATNIEIVDYNDVFNRLQFAADNSFVYNPSAASAWLMKNDEECIEVKGGTLVKL